MANSFEALKLRPELVVACARQGIRRPTPIQAKVIPEILQGRDVMVEAKTGSGKTLAYGLPLLQKQPGQSVLPEALVLTPTRELATQVAEVLRRTTGALQRRVAVLAGGGGMDSQMAELEEGVDVVVGTIGRVEQLLERGILRLNKIRTLVLDEVDELMQGGFSANLAALLDRLPDRRQTLLFSATISHDVERVAKQFMRDPLRLQLESARELPSELSHRVFRTTVKTRVADLAAFLKAERPYQALLFCGTRHEAEELQQALLHHRVEAEFLHGELSPGKRRNIIKAFSAGEFPVLVATDLIARGLDLAGVDVVINYSLPKTPAEYVHRAGRTGRAGKPGVVLTMLIEQQQVRFEHLKQTFPFQKVELHGEKIIVRPIKTREERDRQFRRAPRRVLPAESAEVAPQGRGRGKKPGRKSR